jgi:hypothetical protein
MGQICVDLKGRGRDRREIARAAAERRRNEEGSGGNGWELGIITLGSAPERMAPT